MTYYAFTFNNNEEQQQKQKENYDLDNKIQILLGVSGIGKTHKLFNLGKTQYLIYISAKPKTNVSSSNQPFDHTYPTYYYSINNVKNSQDYSKLYTLVFIFTRVKHLEILINDNNNLTPFKFLLSQVNSSSKIIDIFYRKILEIIDAGIDQNSIKVLIKQSLEKINQNIIISIDEAQNIISQYPKQFISPNDKYRSLITIIGQTIDDLVYFLDKKFISFVYFSGTGLKLLDTEEIESSVGMNKKKAEGYQFDLNDTKDKVWNYLNRCLDMSYCELNSTLLKKLKGRKRICSYVVKELRDDEKFKKQDVLERTINKIFDKFKKDIKTRIQNEYERKETKSEKEKLFKIIINIVTTFWTEEPIKSDYDLMFLGISQPFELYKENLQNGLTKFQLKEQVALEACKEFYEEKFYLHSSNILMNSFTNSLKNLSNKDQEKGILFEHVLFSQLIHHIENEQIKKCGDVKFLKNYEKSIKWLKSVDFNDKKSTMINITKEITPKDEIQLIKEFQESDLIKNLLFFPSHLLGPDLLLIIKYENKYYFLSFSLKYYTNSIPLNECKKSEKTTNLENIYYTNDYKLVNSLEKKHKEFHSLFNNELKNSESKRDIVGGIIRILIHIPKSTNNFSITHDYSHQSDKILYFDKNNINEVIENNDTVDIILEKCNA